MSFSSIVKVKAAIKLDSSSIRVGSEHKLQQMTTIAVHR